MAQIINVSPNGPVSAHYQRDMTIDLCESELTLRPYVELFGGDDCDDKRSILDDETMTIIQESGDTLILRLKFDINESSSLWTKVVSDTIYYSHQGCTSDFYYQVEGPDYYNFTAQCFENTIGVYVKFMCNYSRRLSDDNINIGFSSRFIDDNHSVNATSINTAYLETNAGLRMNKPTVSIEENGDCSGELIAKWNWDEDFKNRIYFAFRNKILISRINQVSLIYKAKIPVSLL